MMAVSGIDWPSEKKDDIGYWRDLSGSGIYQAHAAFNSQKHDLNISK